MSAISREILDDLFREHGPGLRRFLVGKVRCQELAADLLQETFVRLARHERADEVRDLRAYLYGTAGNLAIDHARRVRRRRTAPADLAELAELPDDMPAADQALIARQKLDLLRRAIAELSPLCQQIFELNRLQGLTHAEVARRLGISESTVQKNLAKALLHGMRCLKGL